MKRFMKERTQQKVQWAALVLAITTAVAAASQQGVIPEEIAVYVLAVTNVVSAILRSAVGKPKE